jgi:hypothetical protein
MVPEIWVQKKRARLVENLVCRPAGFRQRDGRPCARRPCFAAAPMPSSPVGGTVGVGDGSDGVIGTERECGIRRFSGNGYSHSISIELELMLTRLVFVSGKTC